MRLPPLPLALSAAAAVVAGVTPAPPAGPPRGVHNVRVVGPGLLSGSSPEGPAGFADLRRLGVRTAVSVDGAAPDVTSAVAAGIRYVHVPIGYDGVPADSAWRVARVLRDLPGPVYVHCHHGRHRGPAAAVAARLCLDPAYTSAEAAAALAAAGTDPRYRGLVGVPHTLPRPTAADLDRLPADFPSTVPVPAFTQQMVAIDARFDALKAARKAGWSDPAASADDALQLFELYREAGRSAAAESHGPAFAELLKQAEATAGELSATLRRDPAAAGPVWGRVGKQCAACHARWRDG